ncbi:FAD/NAD(P)-binding protein [Thalassobacillus sp. C254]|uniref:FAD/NAD(P)-binding protein n=1 Tax=Thalassobacillus sp. C254 TaxID=1225341 RepID=UPI0006D254EA|nr:FAD/NAD(P)-binding protein [Thalassobacillus sp. C254]
MYKWIIIGGGIHGCTIATFLLKSGKVKKDELLIIDPYPVPLYKWKTITSKIGMDYLRSPSVHHLDPAPFSLQKYAKDNKVTAPFIGRFKRPSLPLFNAHCEALFAETDLYSCWFRAKVENLAPGKKKWMVHTTNGRLEAKRVVLAIGMNTQPSYPEWAEELAKSNPHRIHHIFNDDLQSIKEMPPSFGIVGGGISSIHTAVHLCNVHNEKVKLIKRHPFRVHDFDSDPGWLGPKYLTSFRKENDLNIRRKMITQARHRGSMPRNLFMKAKRLYGRGQLEVITDEISGVRAAGSYIDIRLKENPSQKVSSVILTTGAASRHSIHEWLTHMPKCTSCGFPIINKNLEWENGLHVSGPLAELEIGPVSRNIAGARKSAEIITALAN